MKYLVGTIKGLLKIVGVIMLIVVIAIIGPLPIWSMTYWVEGGGHSFTYIDYILVFLNTIWLACAGYELNKD